MFGAWLRSGLGSGRVTSAYPKRDREAQAQLASLRMFPEAVATCNNQDCKLCEDVCPTGAIQLENVGERPVVDTGACISCSLCVNNCPQGVFEWRDNAISTVRSDHVEQSDWGQMARQLRKIFDRSLHLRHIDVGSCNACEAEVLALSNPYYNFHRLGIFFTASPRHADVLLVTGALTHAMKPVLLETYEAMPKPRLVIATGVCAIHGGVFRESPKFAGPVDQVIPVDAWVPGCPPHPFVLIDGILAAMEGRKVHHG